MSKPYFIVAIVPDHDEPWGVHFGDYDKAECEAEQDDIRNTVAKVKLIRCDNDNQATIDAEIDRLNGKASNKDGCALVIKLQLPQRYVVCAYQRKDSDEGLVLVHLPDNKATPFATFRFDHETGHCFSGDYLTTNAIVAAHDAFEKRSKCVV